MKRQKADALVSFAVNELDDSRSMRAGLLELSTGHHAEHRDAAATALAEGDAEVQARSEWLHDPAALSRAGLQQLLKGWHDAAALAAVDGWPLGRYDAVKHPDAIVRVDNAVVEIARRFPDLHKLLEAKCARADLPTLLHADLPQGTRAEAARLAVSTHHPALPRDTS